MLSTKAILGFATFIKFLNRTIFPFSLLITTITSRSSNKEPLEAYLVSNT
jgi:hypothetical protein